MEDLDRTNRFHFEYLKDHGRIQGRCRESPAHKELRSGLLPDISAISRLQNQRPKVKNSSL